MDVYLSTPSNSYYTTSACEQNMQEYKYYHSEVEQKYHDTGNGWTLILVPA